MKIIKPIKNIFNFRKIIEELYSIHVLNNQSLGNLIEDEEDAYNFIDNQNKQKLK